MANKISDETLLLSKYLANNSNKTTDIEKAAKTVTTSDKKGSSNSTGTKYDSLDLSALDFDPLVYNNYNSQGQYETMPSLIDYLGNDSGNGLNNISNNDALKLLGATGGASLSLVDYLAGNDAGKSGGEAYASVFSNMAQESAAKTEALIEQAMEKMKEKQSSAKSV